MSLLFLLQLFAKHGQETKSKVVAIRGDISQPGLALSEEDSHVPTNNVSVVFHAAATINFNASLQSAINTNLVGTKRILQLCHHMPKIKVRVDGCVYMITHFTEAVSSAKKRSECGAHHSLLFVDMF